MSQRVSRHAHAVLRSIFTAISVAIVIIATMSPAQAASVPRKYAGIVVDAKTGKTLYASAADSLRYPASVTKVMTLYILFQEMQAGRLTLKSKMRVSKHAAAAVPTKLGLRAGSTISVKDAIGALVTLSANDISRVIAEHISGTESAFAQRMTRTARALGMTRTTYRNASGLPNSGQVTTARDQARLGIAVYQHFPKQYEYFQMRSFKYGSRSYGNHNRLLGQNGVDGIKTGYIRASGYNLLTAARKSNRHIVVVGFGFNSGAARNAKVAQLISKYLPKARRGSYYRTAMIANPLVGGTLVASRPVVPAARPSFRINQSPELPTPAFTAPAVTLASAVIPVPQTRPVNLMARNAVEATNLVVASTAPRPAPRNLDVIGAWISQTLRLDQKTGAPLLPPASIGSNTAQNNQAIDLLTSGSVKQATQSQPQSQTKGWIIQVGAAPNQAGAERLLTAAAGKASQLGDFRRYIERFEKNGQVFFRARFAGFGQRNQAQSMCTSLKTKQMNCLAVQG